MSIQFCYEIVDNQLFDEKIVRNWIEKVIENEDKRLGEIIYYFVSAERLLEINIEFLGHNYDTDIITFDNSYLKLVSGELYISVEQVRYSSEMLNIDFISELYRVIIHGILHLVGYSDSTAIQRDSMRLLENKYICWLIK